MRPGPAVSGFRAQGCEFGSSRLWKFQAQGLGNFRGLSHRNTSQITVPLAIRYIFCWGLWVSALAARLRVIAKRKRFRTLDVDCRPSTLHFKTRPAYAGPLPLKACKRLSPLSEGGSPGSAPSPLLTPAVWDRAYSLRVFVASLFQN